MTRPTKKEIQVYQDKLYFQIIKPTAEYYNVNLDNEIMRSFCRSLSFYEYETVQEVRDELLTQYKTFPRLPNWISKCKEKQKRATAFPDIPERLKETIKQNENNTNWQLVKERMLKEFGSDVYNSWLSKIFLIYENEQEVLMATETEFIADWIRQYYFKGHEIIKNEADGTAKRYLIKRGIKDIWLERKPNLKSIMLRNVKDIEGRG